MATDGGDSGRLTAIVAAGGTRWPGFGITTDDLTRHAATANLANCALENAADIVLACACLKGNKAALSELDRTIRDGVPAFVRRIDRDAHFADDVGQRLRERLLNDRPPRLGQYGGAGSLAHWLRVAAVRLAIDAKRAERSSERALAETFSDHIAAESRDPEIEILRARHGQALLDVISRGLHALPRRERAVLRLYLLANMNIDDLGRMYGVHRATVARWISRAEKAVFAGVRAEFRARWGIGTTDVASLARRIRSQLPFSLDDAL
jgi:RNA polymerase sigma-70 factor, ECF subfamily